MKRKVVERIAEIFNKGQDVHEIYPVPHLDFPELTWLALYTDGAGMAKDSFGYVNDESIYGFLVGKYGFFKALAKHKGLNADDEVCSGYAWHDNNFASMVHLETELLLGFYYAKNKEAWLEENL